MSSLIRDNLVLDVDSYKLGHFLQYPKNTTKLFAYLEARGGRYAKTVFFGLQPILARLKHGINERDVLEGIEFAKAHGLPFPTEGWNRVLHVHGGKIPLRIRAIAEGTSVPVRNALLTVESMDPELTWLVTWFETQIMRVWYPITVATKSHYCVRTIWEHLLRSSDDPKSEIPFKMHDFGGRGVSSYESACIGGAAHLLNSQGTDTIAGARFAKEFYGMNGPVAGFSIPSSEHSTVTIWGRNNEAGAFTNMIDAHPEFKILANVSDSYDIEHAVEEIWCDQLLDKVKASGKTIVIRPDSGDPCEVMPRLLAIMDRKIGMKTNMKGYKVLPPYFRVIWGDGNKDESSVDRILTTLENLHYSASNIAFGMGGGLLQLVDRDTCQFAYKVSAAKINGDWIDVKKEPKTDAHKVSKAGRLDLVRESGEWKTVRIAPDKKHENHSELRTVFDDGEIKLRYTFDEIRARNHQELYGPVL